MNNTKGLMADIHNTLVQIRYPKIATAEVNNIDSMILCGKARVSLLSWLLSEKSSETAAHLEKLEGVPLEDELLKYYSEIGICRNKNLLLGNCKLEEQLPTLRLLLDFIKYIFIESSDTKHEIESMNDILHGYINEDTSTVVSNTELKLNYSESMQYFDNLQKSLDKYQESFADWELEMEKSKKEDFMEGEIKTRDAEGQNLLFNTEKRKFIETFSTIGSWPIYNTSNSKSTMPSMDAVIQDIHSNFVSLTQFLQAKEEIFNTNVPKDTHEMNVLLNKIIEDTVVSTEETLHVINNC